MKKLSTLLLLASSLSLQALPVGNPSDASLLTEGVIWEGHVVEWGDPCFSWFDLWSLRAGFYGDYVFNRHMQLDENFSDDVIEHVELYTNALYVTINMLDRLDVFGTVGVTNLVIDTNLQSFITQGTLAPTNGRFRLETSSDLSWSVGAKGTLWQIGCTTFGAEFQYFSCRPDVRVVTLASTDSIYPDDVSAHYLEWQVGLGVSHRIHMFVPYVAVKWSAEHLIFDHAVLDPVGPASLTLYGLKDNKVWGYAVGVTIVGCETASITAEGRFGDEKALYINAQARY